LSGFQEKLCSMQGIHYLGLRW